MGEGFEILMLVLVIDGFQIMQNLRTDRGPGFQGVVLRRRRLQREGQQNEGV